MVRLFVEVEMRGGHCDLEIDLKSLQLLIDKVETGKNDWIGFLDLLH